MTNPPPRRHSPAVYRRRRLAVVLAVLLVVGAAVALALWRPWEGLVASSPSPVATTSGSPSPGSSEAPPPSSPPSSPSPSTPAPTPSASGTGTTIPLCSPGDVTVAAVTDRDSYASDEKPQLSIVLSNEGEVACAMDVGTASQVFTISSGTDVWWRSTDCQSDSNEQIVQLEPGQTVSSVAPLVWDRTRSSTDTCKGDRAPARSGYYNLTVSVSGIESEERQFRLR